MYPPGFAYEAPETVAAATARLAEVGEDGRVLAGGQSLIPMMKLRLAAPSFLIDINRIPDLSYIRSQNGHLAIGALTRHAEMVRSNEVQSRSQMMAEAAPWIADPLVRNRGTVCGSVAHCDPEGDWNSVMLALGAQVVAQSTTGSRTISISDFVVGPFTNSLQPGEMVTEIRVPADPPRSGGAYLKLERKIGDYATVGVATSLTLDESGIISRAGIALTSVAPVNLQAKEAEAMLVGQSPSTDLFTAAAEAGAAACEPQSDIRGPADYKRAVVRTYIQRGLSQAWTQAQKEGS